MNYILMNKNIEILEFSYDNETHAVTKIVRVIQPNFAPLGIIEYKTGITKKALNNWWKDRSIPASRSRFKEVMAEMDIHSSVELLERCFGLSLSDQYWIKEENSKIEWNDINFFENLDIFSPDNSSDGNLKKKWKIINGIRYLVKGGNSFNNQEPFNEIIATKLYERILKNEDYVPYELIQENGMYYSACPTMVNTDEELVSAYYIDRTIKQRGNDSLYTHFLEACNSLNIPNAKLQIDKMIVCDYIIANYDRHYRNFGAIRNVNTLEWTGIAPIFDSGSSLWATQPTTRIGTTYKSKPFKPSPDDQLELVDNLTWLETNKLEGFEKEVEEILKSNPLMDEPRIQAIIQQINLRIGKVIERKKQLEKR